MGDLSNAQLEMLRWLIGLPGGEGSCSPRGTAARTMEALERRGLVEVASLGYGSFRITRAGRWCATGKLGAIHRG